LTGVLTAARIRFHRKSALPLVADPTGRFAYVVNMVSNSINVYTIGGAGALTAGPV
jgi:6-phosphogluconolactonase (cycloisomerase 2 family)